MLLGLLLARLALLGVGGAGHRELDGRREEEEEEQTDGGR